MPTGQQFLNRALVALNIIDDGGGVSPSENAGLLVELQAMTDAWSTEETLIPSVSTAQYLLTANQNPYPMGIGAAAPFNVARPVRIDGAYQINGAGRNQLDLIGSKQYFEHNDLSASAGTADELYVDWADVAGVMNLYLFPVPTCASATKLELQTWSFPVLTWALGTNQTLPPGYEDAIVYGLAYRCIPRYGAVVNAEVAQAVTQIGITAKDRIKKLNVMNRLLDPSLAPSDAQRAAAQQPQAGR
jgi:hypothetical protein